MSITTFQKLFKLSIVNSIEQTKHAKINGKIYPVIEYNAHDKELAVETATSAKWVISDSDKWSFVKITLNSSKINTTIVVEKFGDKLLSLIYEGKLKNASYVNLLMYNNKLNVPTVFVEEKGNVVASPARLRYVPDVEIKDLLLAFSNTMLTNSHKFGVNNVQNNPEFMHYRNEQADELLNSYFKGRNNL